MAVDGSAWKSNTVDTYRNLLHRHVLPTFGARPVPAITVADVECWWAALCGKRYSRKHLGNARGVLTAILKRAVTSGLLMRNRADAIAGRIGRENREVRQAEWLTEAELSQVLRVAETREHRYYPHLLTLASTGLRLGEVLGLQLPDVDLPRAKLRVRRGIRKYRVGSPKSGKARTVDVPASTIGVLEAWIATVRATAAARGAEARWLFPSSTGRPLNEHQTRDVAKNDKLRSEEGPPLRTGTTERLQIH